MRYLAMSFMSFISERIEQAERVRKKIRLGRYDTAACFSRSPSFLRHFSSSCAVGTAL